MRNNYYVLMNDDDSQYQPIYLAGILDVVEGKSIPVKGSCISFPRDAYNLDQNEIFWNFDQYEHLDFDYREDSGHIVSAKFVELLKGFTGAPHRVRKLTIWMNGEKQDHNYFYIVFDRGAWAKGVQLNKEFIFYDEEHSIFERNVHGGIIPTGDIVLTKNVEAYDFFQLLSTSYLGQYIIVNEEIKEKVEASEIKGVKVIPLNDAFKTHCKDYRVSISDLLAEVKKDKLKLKKDKLKFK